MCSFKLQLITHTRWMFSRLEFETWRHDSVLILLTLKPELEKRIKLQNNSHINVDSFAKPPPITSSFVKADSKSTLSEPRSKTSDRNILSNANDWKLLIDFDHDNIICPQRNIFD